MNYPQPPGFEITEKIGAGSFSIVYKAHVKNKPNEIVAIKCIDKQYHKKSFADNIVKEISFLKYLKHEYIVEMKDFMWDAKHIFIITEYCDEGDLARFIRCRHKLRESIVKKFMQQLVLAIQYLRTNNVCHMDLKPQNLLLTSKPKLTLKVADFGLSQHLTTEGSEHCRYVGSPLYMAPEKLLNQKFDGRVDLWSIGIIMYECLFGRPPYTNLSTTTLNLMSKQIAIELPKHANISHQCEDILKQLLKHNPEERIEFETLFRHEFLDLDHIPTAHNYHKAHDLIQQAIKLDQETKHAESLPLYEEAIRLIQPLTLSVDLDSHKRSLMKIRLNEYIQWTRGLKEYLQGNTTIPISSTSKPIPLSDGNFESLCSLAAATPALAAALEIGRMGELYLAEGQRSQALDKFRSALGLLVPSLQTEPAGLRRNLLHIQVQGWLHLAESIQVEQS